MLRIVRLSLIACLVAAAVVPAYAGGVVKRRGSRRHDEEGVRLAVFRMLVGPSRPGMPARWYSDGEYPRHVYFLSVEGRRDPSPRILAAFRNHAPEVKPVSACTTRQKWSVIDRTTGNTGTIFSVDQIVWSKDGSADVYAGYSFDPLGSKTEEYIVRPAGSGWRVIPTGHVTNS